MIPLLYPRFTSLALNVHGGPLARSPPPGASRHPPAPPYPGPPPPPPASAIAPPLDAALIVDRWTAKRRRGYLTLRECSEILWKCARRNAAISSLARNSQTNRPTTRLERHGRTADWQTVTPSNSRQVYPRPESTRSATSRPRIAPRPLDAESHPAGPARRRRRARPTYTRGSALRRPKRPARGVARLPIS